jgi:hypothetical protein
MVAHRIAKSSHHGISTPTPLTAKNARAGSGPSTQPRRQRPRVAPRRKVDGRPATSRAACLQCGQLLGRSRATYCGDCFPKQRANAGAIGRTVIAARLATGEGRAERRQQTRDGIATVRAMNARAVGFAPNDWTDNILPKLAEVPLKEIARVTGTTVQHASRVRRGVRVPHPRHWAALRALVEA